MEQISPALFVPLFMLAFVVMWIIVARFLSLFGWSTLAEHHLAVADPSPNAKRLLWQSMSIGPGFFAVNYGSCINAWFEREGMFLRPSMMFRLFHPMLFLRWNQVQSVEESNFLLFKRVKLQMKGGTPPISATGRLGREIQEQWQRAKPLK
ncbi:hypothetical protein [uncultured Sphingorhabdus sp.]|uniref:hypothetical protein n=1 Tax=uncultured Sphingorhabdus sp. TaxID=1686106 RepID=UPI0026257FAE|nr:hypothetical protein [uncultured Sphingorhabdus sp.]HMS20247.1 hypothetical protein [Sphingorhabdus sp.]